MTPPKEQFKKRTAKTAWIVTGVIILAVLACVVIYREPGSGAALAGSPEAMNPKADSGNNPDLGTKKPMSATQETAFAPTIPNKQPQPGNAPAGMVWISGGDSPWVRKRCLA